MIARNNIHSILLSKISYIAMQNPGCSYKLLLINLHKAIIQQFNIIHTIH